VVLVSGACRKSSYDLRGDLSRSAGGSVVKLAAKVDWAMRSTLIPEFSSFR